MSKSARIWRNSRHFYSNFDWIFVEIFEKITKNILICSFSFKFRYSEDVFSQHSHRHSNDTNSDLSDDEIFLPDETKMGIIRRTCKTGDILASPTHRKITPTNIRSTGSSPIKKLRKGRSEFRSLDNGKLENLNAEEIHSHYRNVIADLKKTHDENVKQLTHKMQNLGVMQTDDEYLVSVYQ